MRVTPYLFALGLLGSTTALAQRPPPEPPPPTITQRFDDVQADIEAVKTIVGKLKGKGKAVKEAKDRLDRMLAELQALEDDTRPVPCPIVQCPPIPGCPPIPACPPVQCPPCPTVVAEAAPPIPLAVINGATDLCLGVQNNGRPRAGDAVEVAPCLGDRGQRPPDHQWTVVPAAPGYSFIKNEASGLCLGIRGVDQAGLMAEAEVLDCLAAGGDQRLDNQWKLVETKRGELQLRNRVSDLCLSVQGGDRHAPGALALLDRCDQHHQGRDSLWRTAEYAALLPSVIVQTVTQPVPVPVPPPPVRVVTPISDAEFAKIAASVDNQSFATDKMRILKMAIAGKPVTVAQVKAMIEKFSFSQEKLDVVRVMNPSIVNKDERYQLFDVFTFDSDKKGLEEILK